MLNQFCEFANHLAHLRGHRPRRWPRVFDHVAAASRPGLRLAAFVSATGSAGTIAAGDRLKERYGARIVAVEALECPTMLENGFGEHNIQGIGDKHIPLIHNVMNTDVVVAVSDRATDELDVLFNTDAGRAYLVERQGVDADGRRPARATSASRRSATCSPPSRRRSCSASGPTTPSSPSPPTAPGSTAASGPRPLAASLRRTLRRASTPPRSSPSTSPSVGTDHIARVHRAGPQPHLQPRLLHVGRAAGHAARRVRGPPVAGVLAGAARPAPRVWDGLIDEFNDRTGPVADP